MQQTTQLNDERINLRLKKSAKSTLERAAAFEGETISKFILKSAIDKAEETIQNHETAQLNAGDSFAFFEAISKPVEFNENLREAMQEHDERVVNK